MSKIYTVNNGISAADQIPSIEYVNELVKMIEDRLTDNGSIEGFPSIKTNSEKLSLNDKEVTIVHAKDIKTDSNHKFVSDGILATIANRATKFDIERSADDVKSDLRNYMDSVYMKIINTPNVINKLRDISTILNEDEAIAGLLNTMAYKVNFKDFEEHNKSSIHMSAEDRQALDLLLKCLIAGFADWDAKDDAYNAIKNKPNSLPANGGNADTVSNHNINELIDKYDYDVVIGRDGEKYSHDSCNIYAEDGYINSEALRALIKSTKNSVILFKRGEFNTDSLDCDATLKIFNGVDHRLTIIKAKDFVNIYNSVFKNIGFVDSKIYIGSDCEINNTSFTNCEIIFTNTVASNITNCKFDNCTIKYLGNMMNNIIKFNRYVRTKPITYIGGNNIITENI